MGNLQGRYNPGSTENSYSSWPDAEEEKMMGLIGVVADDFTGTASAGVLVARTGVRTGLFFDTTMLDDLKEGELDAVYVSSNSRNISPDAANAAVTEAAKKLQQLGAQYFSKKIDTTLRGGIGYEIDAMLDVLGEDSVAVMVPAMPASRRICVGGHSIIDGTILTETAVAHDVKSPVHSCYVPEIIGEQSRCSNELILLKDVLKGKNHVRELLVKAKENGSRIIIVDAITMEHIETVAAACAELQWNILAVDPGPFTMLLAKCRGLIGQESRNANALMGESTKAKEAGMLTDRISKQGRKTALFVIGSANPSTKTQIEKFLTDVPGTVRISGDPLKLLEGGPAADEEVLRITEETENYFSENAVASGTLPKAIVIETALHGSLLDLAAADRSHGYPDGRSSDLINEGLAKVTEKLLEEVGTEKIAGLMLSGGDTMESVCRRIGVTCIRAIDNISAQVDVGRIIGKYNGMPVVVKGGFCGYESVAEDIAERILREARQD